MDALNLGDKLQSILYYHFLPQAYNATQLESLGSANTDLGVSTGTPYNLTFGQSPTGQVRDGSTTVSLWYNVCQYEILEGMDDLLHERGEP